MVSGFGGGDQVCSVTTSFGFAINTFPNFKPQCFGTKSYTSGYAGLLGFQLHEDCITNDPKPNPHVLMVQMSYAFGVFVEKLSYYSE